jgi:putative spermidine/putrescine transport system substrate-binding protein
MRFLNYLSIVAAAALSINVASAESDELVFVSWGGSYQDAIREAWLKPFSKETGVNILEETGPDTAKVKAMVDSGSVTWDIITDGEAGVLQGARAGLIEEITSEMVNQDHVYPQMRNPYGVPSEVFSTVYGFSTEAFPDGGLQPSSWADFFDVEKFPGKRALRARPGTILEAALMADGVPNDQVHKILNTTEGQDRAFKKIEEIRPHVALWWTAGAQPAQALGSGEVVMSNGWNGRLQTGIDNGLPIKIVWNGAVAELGYFMLVKGSPNRDAAIKLLSHMVSPAAQAEFHKYVSYGPITPKAWDSIPKESWSRLPSSPEILKQSVFLDAQWWVENGDAMRERYQATISQ